MPAILGDRPVAPTDIDPSSAIQTIPWTWFGITTKRSGPISRRIAPEAVPYALIVTRDGLQQVRLLYDTRTQCRSIQVGDYLEADGEKQHEFLFEAHNFTITRGGRSVR